MGEVRLYVIIVVGIIEIIFLPVTTEDRDGDYLKTLTRLKLTRNV